VFQVEVQITLEIQVNEAHKMCHMCNINFKKYNLKCLFGYIRI